MSSSTNTTDPAAGEGRVKSARYWRKGLVTIRAIQLAPETFSDCLAFLGPNWTKADSARCRIKVLTLEGYAVARVGDFIIYGGKGEFYACKPDIFAATYEPAESPAPQTAGEISIVDELEDAILGWWCADSYHPEIGQRYRDRADAIKAQLRMAISERKPSGEQAEAPDPRVYLWESCDSAGDDPLTAATKSVQWHIMLARQCANSGQEDWALTHAVEAFRSLGELMAALRYHTPTEST